MLYLLPCSTLLLCYYFEVFCMQKIYLKYDEYTPPVECDYGFIPEMVYLGFLYPIKKKNYKMFYIMLMTEVAVSTLIMCFIPFIIGIIICIVMLFVINLLFAANYNSSDILIKKGIYFKLQ